MIGRLDIWKFGMLEGCKVVRVEGWKVRSLEG